MTVQWIRDTAGESGKICGEEGMGLAVKPTIGAPQKEYVEMESKCHKGNRLNFASNCCC